MRALRISVGVALLAAAFAACDLNPQPLPPGTDNADSPGSSSGGGGERFGMDGSSADAGSQSALDDAGPEPPVPNNGDAGDGGDAGGGEDAGDAGNEDAGDGGDAG